MEGRRDWEGERGRAPTLRKISASWRTNFHVPRNPSSGAIQAQTNTWLCFCPMTTLHRVVWLRSHFLMGSVWKCTRRLRRKFSFQRTFSRHFLLNISTWHKQSFQSCVDQVLNKSIKVGASDCGSRSLPTLLMIEIEFGVFLLFYPMKAGVLLKKKERKKL